ncbi:ribokinase [Pseudogemmobacter sp. W21_MBD1_M6]|uniref:ribokinase n=1 Tax=Pseudogemmobacter sp. W21_MBD1_M6 TaxID=3240271 RepID=UPI003F9B208B
MTIYVLGSINADHVYDVPHLPAPGETLSASAHSIGLGGKGANQSVAAAKAGGRVIHIGAVGDDGQWAVRRMAGYGVDVAHIAGIDGPTGHAIINVDASGENSIVIFSGANAKQSQQRITEALNDATAGDLLLLQNETSQQAFAAALGRQKKMTVVYSAAPFEIGAVVDVLPHVSLLVLNEVEAQQLCAALSTTLEKMDVPEIVVTLGGDGADWYDNRSGQKRHVAAVPTTVVDTTSAGDTFLGYVAAGLSEGLGMEQSMALGAMASAIKIRTLGAADAIPERSIVDQELSGG